MISNTVVICIHTIILVLLIFGFTLNTIIHELGHALKIRKYNKTEKIVIALGYQEKIIHKKRAIIRFNNISIYYHKMLTKSLKQEKLVGLVIPESEFNINIFKPLEIMEIAKAGAKLQMYYLLIIGVSFVLTFINSLGIIDSDLHLANIFKLIFIPIVVVMTVLICRRDYLKSSDCLIASSEQEAIKFCEMYKNKSDIYKFNNYIQYSSIGEIHMDEKTFKEKVFLLYKNNKKTGNLYSKLFDYMKDNQIHIPPLKNELKSELATINFFPMIITIMTVLITISLNIIQLIFNAVLVFKVVYSFTIFLCVFGIFLVIFHARRFAEKENYILNIIEEIEGKK